MADSQGYVLVEGAGMDNQPYRKAIVSEATGHRYPAKTEEVSERGIAHKFTRVMAIRLDASVDNGHRLGWNRRRRYEDRIGTTKALKESPPMPIWTTKWGPRE